MIDLHMHSRYSEDGEFTPPELVQQCAKKGICMMSITDHNCVKANEEAQKTAKEYGIIYVPGIEADCTYENINFHVLGYGIDYLDNRFETIETHIKTQNDQVSLERLAKTQALGFQITEGEMQSLSKENDWQYSWTGEMFAEILLAMPEYTRHPLLEPYRPGGTRSDNPYVNFYWDYYAQGKPCYAKTNYPAMEEVLDIIHRTQGAAVIAHPGVNLKGKESMLDHILPLGFDGIEAFSSYHTPQQAELFVRAAHDRNMFVTCGSDYHGKTKPSIGIGQHCCPVPYEEIITHILQDKMCL